MSTLNPGGRRSLDGPIRRAPVSRRPAYAPQVSTQVAAPSSAGSVSAAVPAREAQEPVFEYRKPRKTRLNWLRRVRFAAVGMVVLVLVAAGWFGYKSFNAAKNIISSAGAGAPALAGALDPTKLKGEGDGRINIMLLGVGGPGHEGPNLSDTIMVWSIDPKTKDVAVLSIPRDLYVKIPNKGYSKINAANAYGGPELAKNTIEKVIGVPIHYHAIVDFSGFKQAVDAVGGIDINVEQAIYDPTYPCDNGRGHCPLRVAAGQQHMNGTTALRYARSRHTTSDFDRAARQQQVMVAVRQKALQASTLTNPVKLAALIDAVGGHFKTDLQLNEIKKLALIAKDVDTKKITQKVLDTVGDDSLLIDGSGMIPGAGSIELPRAGNFVYSDIHDFVKNIFVDHYITDENAKVEVQNGSGITGAAGVVSKSLKSAHYNVLGATNADENVSQTVIYDYTGGKKPYTVHYLERRFGVKARVAAAPSPAVDANGNAVPAPEIRIILGSNYKSNTTYSQ